MLDTTSEDWDKFMSEAELAKTLETQLAMSPQTVAALRSHGVKATDALKLEFFFLTNTEPKASALASELAAKGYAVKHGISEGYNKYLITGWSTPMKMDETVVVEWTRAMCELGYKYDCDFDGWGTNPDQKTKA
jgi:hypothetical protein